MAKIRFQKGEIKLRTKTVTGRYEIYNKDSNTWVDAGNTGSFEVRDKKLYDQMLLFLSQAKRYFAPTTKNNFSDPVAQVNEKFVDPRILISDWIVFEVELGIINSVQLMKNPKLD